MAKSMVESTSKMALAAPVTNVAADGPPEEKDKEKKSCLHNQLHKTRFCMYQAKGTCQYGDQCGFAHSNVDLQAAPDLRKTRLCQAFIDGGCDDPKCTFAHGENELRSSDVFFKKTLCIWNAKGKCRNGEQCRFAHGKRQLRATPEQQPVAESPSAGASVAATGRQAQVDPPSVNNDPDLEPMKIQSSLNLADVAPPPPVVPPQAKPPQSKAEIKAELQRLRQCVSDLTTQCSSLKKVLYNPQDGIDFSMLNQGVEFNAGMGAYGFGKEMIQQGPPGLTSDWYGASEASSW